MQRVHYFDFLNILACISVVALHCNGYTHTFAHDAPWKQAIFFETVFYSAVPIFFMLSGATLFNYRSRYTTAQFYKKRYTKTLIPYLVFGIGLYTLHFLKQSVSSGAAFDVNHFLSAMLTGQIPFANFWFFIPLFMVYLFIPFLERIVNQSSTKELFLLVSIVFFFSAIVPIANHLGHWNITQATSIGGYCIYAILGYALTKTEVEKKQPHRIHSLLPNTSALGNKIRRPVELNGTDPIMVQLFRTIRSHTCNHMFYPSQKTGFLASLP